MNLPAHKLYRVFQFSFQQSIAFDRTKFDILVRRRFLFDQSYDIYGGASGLFDLGPVGCAIKVNLIQLWRQLFVLEEQMLEIDCPALTIRNVFKASGHIDRFTDYLVKDVVTDECFRIDHLIKAHLEELCSRSKNDELRAEYTDILVKVRQKLNKFCYFNSFGFVLTLSSLIFEIVERKNHGRNERTRQKV